MPYVPPRLLVSEVWEGEDWPDTVARLAYSSGALVTLADVDSISLSIYWADDPEAADPPVPVYGPTAIDKATGGPGGEAVIYDTLQTDGYAIDDQGYNFRHFLGASSFAGEGGMRYLLVYTVVRVSPRGPLKIPHSVYVRALSGV